MPNYNSKTIVGHLGKDPQLRKTQSGIDVCNFTVATNRKRGDSEETDWHQVVCWKGVATAAARELRKGSAVVCIGTDQTRQWTNNDGETRTIQELNAFIVGAPLYDKQERQPSGERSQYDRQPELSDDDIPF